MERSIKNKIENKVDNNRSGKIKNRVKSRENSGIRSRVRSLENEETRGRIRNRRGSKRSRIVTVCKIYAFVAVLGFLAFVALIIPLRP